MPVLRRTLSASSLNPNRRPAAQLRGSFEAHDQIEAMNAQERKFNLFARLQALGFTYDEAVALRRIEMTLHRWAEEECNGTIQRIGDEDNAKPFRVLNGPGQFRPQYRIADREAGALKRLAAIVEARNTRESPSEFMRANAQDWVFSYHQTDPRGCALYLVKRSDIGADQTIEQVYYRGLAVCA